MKIVTPEPLATTLEELQPVIESTLERIDAAMSTYRDDSELMQLNHSASTERTPISAELARVLLLAQDISRQSKGAFDVTVQPVVELWGFGRSSTHQQARTPPSSDRLEALRASIGSDRFAVSAAAEGEFSFEKTTSDLQIDLSAIAKGYAVDLVSALLEQRGYENTLVEIGGEIAARGHNRKGGPWVLAVERPTDAPTRSIQRLLRAASPVALATSGDYRNFYVHEGRKYSHTIDPRTLAPVTHSGASVSVLADDCATADAWATALLVLGPERGPEVAEQNGIAAWFLSYESDGNDFATHETSAFSARLEAAAVSN